MFLVEDDTFVAAFTTRETKRENGKETKDKINQQLCVERIIEWKKFVEEEKRN